MATYLQGVTDYIPQYQPFQPDFNFYQGVLQTKESQYQAGYDRLSSVYGTLLNSPMLREGNIERREKFFNQINNDIERMAQMDLSKETNIDAAYKVFQPMIDDDYIMKDMAWTKTYQRELSKAEGFRNCTDEKKCGGKWWEGGVRALNYQAEDFSRSTDDESLKFANARYTPFVNVQKEAFKMAKDMGFNVQNISWSPDGKYIVTTKGGQPMVMPLYQFFTGAYGTDAKVMDMYNTQAYLARKDFAKANATQFGTETDAERVYLNTMLEEVNKRTTNVLLDTEDAINQVNVKKDTLTEKAKIDGLTPGKDDDMFALYDQLGLESEYLNTNQDQYNNTLNLVNQDDLTGIDMDSLRWRVDKAVANQLFNSDMYSVADTYARLNTEVDIKADPYALASFNHSLALSRIDYAHKLKKADELEKQKKSEEAFRLLNPTLFTPQVAGEGTSLTGDVDPNAKPFEENVKEENLVKSSLMTNSAMYVSQSLAYLESLTKSTDPVIKKQAIAWINQLAEDSPALKAGLRNGTLKYTDVMKIYNDHVQSPTYDDKNSPYHFSNLYDKVKGVVKQFGVLPSTAGANTAMRLADLYEQDINYSQAHWKTLDQMQTGNNKNVANSTFMLSELTLDVAKNNRELFLDNNGDIRTEEDFTNAFMKKNFDVYKDRTKKVTYERGIQAEEPEYKNPDGSYNIKAIYGDLYTGAKNAYKDLNKAFIKTYNGNNTQDGQPLVKVFNGSILFNKESGGWTSKPYLMSFDVSAPTTPGTQAFVSTLNNIMNSYSDPDVKFQMGGAKSFGKSSGPSIATNNKDAQEFFGLLQSGITSYEKPNDENRFRGKIVQHTVGGGDSDYVAYEIKPDANWIKKMTGTKGAPGPLYDKDFSNGITVYLPKNKANNSFYNQTTIGLYQTNMNLYGSVSKNIPGGGYVNINRQEDGSYLTEVGVNIYDQTTGKYIVDNMFRTFSSNAGADQIIDLYSPMLVENAENNDDIDMIARTEDDNTVYDFNE